MTENHSFEEMMCWFNNVLIKHLKPKCPFCGAELTNYWFYEYNYSLNGRGVREFQICPRCKEKVVRK